MRLIPEYRNTVVLVLIALTTLPASAQTKKEPPQRHVPSLASPDSATRPLPKIDLPEFIITGNEVVDFKEFAKDRVDPSQPTLMGASKGEGKPLTADLGLHVSSMFPRSTSLNGSVAVGYGSFGSPYLEGWFGTSAGTGSVLLQTGIATSDGHVPNAGYRHGYSNLTGRWVLSEESPFLAGASMDGSLGITGDSYRLYGSITPRRERTVTLFSSSVGVSLPDEGGFSHQGRFGMRTTRLDDSTVAGEREMSAAVKTDGTIEGIDVKATADIDWNFYESPIATRDPFLFHAGISGRTAVTEALGISGGLSWYLYRGSDTPTRGALLPSFEVTWSVGNGIRIYGAFEPEIQRADLSTLIEQNPYLRTGVGVRHPDHRQRFLLGVGADISPMLKSSLVLSYDRIYEYALFTDPLRTGLWDIRYDGRTSSFSIEGSVYADLGADDHLGVSVSLRSVENSGTGNAVPFVAATGANVLYSHQFPIGINLRTTVQLVGSAPADPENTRSLPGFGVVSLEGVYGIVRQVEGVAKVENIFNSRCQRFEGYPGRSRFFQAGIRFTW